jgi:hypothetical protein
MFSVAGEIGGDDVVFSECCRGAAVVVGGIGGGGGGSGGSDGRSVHVKALLLMCLLLFMVFADVVRVVIDVGLVVVVDVVLLAVYFSIGDNISCC